MHEARAARTTRGLLVACSATLLAALAHTLGGGTPPGAVALAVALAFSVPFAIVMVGAKSGFVRASIAALAAQLALHATFSLSAGSSPAATHVGHGALVAVGTSSSAWLETAGTGHDGHVEPFAGAMLLGHVAAAMLAVAAIALTDRAVRLVAAAARGILVAVALLLAPALAVVPRRNGRPRSSSRMRPALAWLESSLVRRGPPRGIGAAVAAHAH